LLAVSETKPTSTRPYRMRARAEAAAASGLRILEAAEEVLDEYPTDEFTLTEVAKRADVAVQTIIRRFESRHGLIIATLSQVALAMGKDRGVPPTDEPVSAINGLVDHYDRFGNWILRLYAEEQHYEGLQAMGDTARAYHQRWCEQAFVAALEGLGGVERERRVAQLFAVTGVYFWSVLRHDRGLSRRQTKLAMRELLEPLMERDR
jgi:AcrR family transcriptional regulator